MGNRSIILAALALCFLASSPAQSQCSGQAGGNQVCGTPNAASGLPKLRPLVSGDLPAINLGAGGAGGVTGTLGVGNGGTGGTSYVASEPIIGGGGGGGTAPFIQGVRQGNTTKFFTATGVFNTNDCVKVDASGNAVSSGGLCGTGGLVVSPAPMGRLTLTTGLPIMTNSVVGATIVRYTPALGNVIPIYDGSSLVPTTFAELTNDTTQSVVNKAGPLAVANNTIYDLFVWNDGGTVRLTRGPAWTNSGAGTSTRGSGAGTSEIVLINGIWMNAQIITNGPAAQRGTYVGSVRSNGTATIDFQLGALNAAAPPTPANISIWNLYNQSPTRPNIADQSAAWTFSSATIGPLNGSTNNRISWLQGIADNSTIASIVINGTPASVGSAMCAMGWGVNSTTAYYFADFIILPPGFSITASISTTTLTVTATPGGGSLSVGQYVFGAGVAAGTIITAMGTGTGGNGTYTVNISQTVGSEGMTVQYPTPGPLTNLKAFVPVQPLFGYNYLQVLQSANGTHNCTLQASNGNAQIWY